MRAVRAAVLGLLVIVAVGALPPTAAFGQGQRTAPVAHWPLDGIQSGHTPDTSGHTNDASATGVSVVPGHFGNAFSFTGRQDQQVRVADSASLEPKTITVAAWVRGTASPGAYRYVVDKGASGCVAASYALYSGSSGGMFFYVFDGGSYVLSPDAGTRIWDGNWHSVVGTYDGAVVRLFVDDKEIGSGSPTHLAIAYHLPTDNDLFIGHVGGPCAGPFTGDIDDVTIWGQSLTSAQLASSITTVPGGNGGRIRTSLHHRASLAAAVQSPTKVALRLSAVARTLAVSGAVFALVLFPSELFNSTLEENSDEIRGWFGSLRRRTGQLTGWLPTGFWETWTGFAAFTLVSALLYGLLSPALGLNLGSATNLLSIALGITAVTLLFALPTRRLMAKRHGDRGHIKVAPATIGIALICVVVSRLAHFQPGYLYGLVAGFVFTAEATSEEAGRAVARSGVWMLAIAVIAWVVRTPIDTMASKPGAAVGVVILDAVLAALFIAGIEGVVFALLPLRFLDGSRLLAWNRKVWAVLFGVGVVLFVHVLLDPHNGYIANPTATPLMTIIVMFAVFAFVSVSFWAFFRFRPARQPSQL